MVFSCASANAYDVIGRVVSSQQAPLVCTERSGRVSSQPVATALIGAAIGHQFGSGDGRKTMTALGAIAGALVGSANARANQDRMDCRSDGYVNVIQYEDKYGNLLATTRLTQQRLPEGQRIRINAR